MASWELALRLNAKLGGLPYDGTRSVPTTALAASRAWRPAAFVRGRTALESENTSGKISEVIDALDASCPPTDARRREPAVKTSILRVLNFHLKTEGRTAAMIRPCSEGVSGVF